MNFQGILKELPEYKKLKKQVDERNLPLYLTGLNQIHKAHIIAALSKESNQKILVIVEDDARANSLKDDLNFFYNKEVAGVFLSRDYNFRKMTTASKEYEFARLNTLSLLLSGKIKVLVASSEGAAQYTVAEETFLTHSLIITTNQSLNLKKLKTTLVSAGYEATMQVSRMGEFSVRGGIIDVFSPSEEAPVRIELWGDEVDTITTFDLLTQRRIDSLNSTNISPTTEVICSDLPALGTKIEKTLSRVKSRNKEEITENFSYDIERLKSNLNITNMDRYLPLIEKTPTTIFDYFSKDDLIIISEITNIKEILRSQDIIHNEDLAILSEENLILPNMDGYYIDFLYMENYFKKNNTIFMDVFARNIGNFLLKDLISFNALTLSPWSGDIKTLTEDIEGYLYDDYKIIILAGSEKSAKELARELRLLDYNVITGVSFENLLNGQILVSSGALSSGLNYPDIKTAIFTYPSVLNIKKSRQIVPKRKKGMIKSLANLLVGDYIVHNSHGIGLFQGIHKIEAGGLIKDYIKIKYAGEDILYVPVTQLDMVTKYIGPKSDSGTLRLNRLNSGQWEKTKSRVRESAAIIAKELIELYAKRENSKGYSFSIDTPWQQEFEASFPYEETQDQLICIDEIKKDMEKPIPMDRLLCGDVGFGKTEVALRAAFKALMDNKQVAILVPTTILAWQHYNTMIKRFGNFPVKIGLLSRFRTKKQQEETVRQLRRGEVDIVVGTHRIVQKDIMFKDIGLAIIDEEQRFGVKHKEELKKQNPEIDILTLSATPIPRTLNMAMSGIRDISIIEDPPQNRQPVQTYVLEHDEGVVQEAIRREVRRGGQVYYVHNRINSINRVTKIIREALPDVRVDYAHGQMPEEQLSEVWRQLVEHEIDVLVSTTIIETGVDVPNANTLIIDNADRLGLSQLYQIRGRVGRSSRRAFSYFTFPQGKALTEISTKRLNAIKEFTDFGSGFQIAIKDLEIRGAGNLLGDRQHGHMDAVGYDMYIKLLAEAVATEKGEEPKNILEETLVDINLEAHIPEKYIGNLSQRIDIYKKIASILNKDDALDVTDELIDRFGEPPASVIGLINVALLRNMATYLRFTEIVQSKNLMLFYQDPLDMEAAVNLAVKLSGRVTINAKGRPYISVRIDKNKNPLSTMETVLTSLLENKSNNN